MNAPTVLIYQHIPKCGGTAFREACARMFPVQHELFDGDPPPVPDLVPDRGIRMVTGHYIHDGVRPRDRFGATLDQPYVKLITVLRDPFSRALSAFHFRLQREIRTAPLERFLERRANPMARFLGCDGDVEGWLKTMHFVGINEALQDSVDLLSAMLGIDSTHLERVNVTRGKSQSPPVPPDLAELFRRNNALDYEIYHAARARFDQECRKRLGREPAYPAKAA